MMRTFQELKQSARDNLSGNWLKTMIGIFIATSIVSGLNFLLQATDIFTGGLDYKNLNSFSQSDIYFPLSLISFVVTFLFNGPIAYGYAHYFLKLAKKEDTNIGDFFKGMKKFAFCFETNFILNLLFFLWSLLISIVYMIALSLLTIIMFSKQFFVFSVIFMVIATIVYVIILIYIYARYALVFYLMVDCEKTKPINYIKQSKEMMSGHAKEYLFLTLSFFGWGLLGCFFVLLGGSLAVFSYINATFTEFYLDILEETKNSYSGLQYVKFLEHDNSVDRIYLESLNKDDLF